MPASRLRTFFHTQLFIKDLLFRPFGLISRNTHSETVGTFRPRIRFCCQVVCPPRVPKPQCTWLPGSIPRTREEKVWHIYRLSGAPQPPFPWRCDCLRVAHGWKVTQEQQSPRLGDRQSQGRSWRSSDHRVILDPLRRGVPRRWQGDSPHPSFPGWQTPLQWCDQLRSSRKLVYP